MKGDKRPDVAIRNRLLYTKVFTPKPPSELKRLLAYDPETGAFTRLVRVNRKHDVGSVAGSLTYQGYIRIFINRSHYLAHRLAFFFMTGAFPQIDIDHINGVRSDNRWANLRVVTHSDNAKNMRLPADNKSGVIGVRWQSRLNKWSARIGIDGKEKYLGAFATLEEAASARKHAEALHGFHPNHGRTMP